MRPGRGSVEVPQGVMNSRVRQSASGRRVSAGLLSGTHSASLRLKRSLLSSEVLRSHEGCRLVANICMA